MGETVNEEAKAGSSRRRPLGDAAAALRRSQIDELRDRGYVIVRHWVEPGDITTLVGTAAAQLAARVEPLELEADLRYPGAPPSRSAAGGATVRRLLDAYARDRVFAHCATADRLRCWMEDYFREGVVLSRAHHNCVMTKHPCYGSLTGWHRDIRYWSFEREDLLSVWIALGQEEVANGALWFVPGSHRMTLEADRFDGAKFLRADVKENAAIIDTAESPPLSPGDAVVFHCSTLHSAGRNSSDGVKFSLVYTYHGRSNPPRPGSRSAAKPEVGLL